MDALSAPENLRKRSSSEAEKAKEKESKDRIFSEFGDDVIWYNGITLAQPWHNNGITMA